LLDAPETVKYIRFKRLNRPVIHSDWIILGYQKKKNYGKFCGRRPVGRPRLRYKDIRRECSVLLNIKVSRRPAGDRDIWGRTVEEVMTLLKKKKRLL
jgi:hypothetical protein